MPLCARGKAAARAKFDVYPSAYANAYAVKVCLGKIPDRSGSRKADPTYVKHYKDLKASGPSWSPPRKSKSKSKSKAKSKRKTHLKAGGQSNLRRWFDERWINVCDSTYDSSGRIVKAVPCGRSKSKSKSKYPYCRPLHKVSKDTPRTVGSLSAKTRRRMCQKKRKSPEKIIRLA